MLFNDALARMEVVSILGLILPLVIGVVTAAVLVKMGKDLHHKPVFFFFLSAVVVSYTISIYVLEEFVIWT
jgi:hypothetical protein